MIDPVDATAFPREALDAAMLGLEAHLAMKDIDVDALARLELLDVALNDLAAEYDAALVDWYGGRRLGT